MGNTCNPFMKQGLFCVVFLLLLSADFLKAQDSLDSRKIIYKVQVTDYSGNLSMGYLANLNDSVLFLSDSPHSFSFKNANNSDMRKFDYSLIQQVQIKRNGNLGRGSALGALAGLISAGIGYAVYDIYVPKITDQQFINYNKLNFITIGISGVVIGGTIGAILGLLIHKTYYILGMKQNLNKMKMDIRF